MVSELTRFETPLQTIELNDMDDLDRILDVGAGGEGLVARLKGEGVCGVDLRKEEIQEIRGRGVDCNWVVCDARRLCFKEEAFDLVTLWFSLMYIVRTEDKVQVLSECKKAMRKNGLLCLMDANISTQKDVFILNAELKFPDGQIIRAGYGVSSRQEQNFCKLKAELAKLGFEMVKRENREHWFRIVCRKQASA